MKEEILKLLLKYSTTDPNSEIVKDLSFLLDCECYTAYELQQAVGKLDFSNLDQHWSHNDVGQSVPTGVDSDAFFKQLIGELLRGTQQNRRAAIQSAAENE